MSKRALCIGINDYPGTDNDLRGCVNDANSWADLLVEHYDFAKPDVTVLLDKQATKTGIMQALGSLLKGAKKGDVLVFTNSSHGTYLADTNGDEELYDEALCPWDIMDNEIIDDELRELFSDIPTGVRFNMISDSCHSGSVTRVIEDRSPDQRRVRFLNPRLRGDPVLENPFKAKPKNKQKYPESGMKELLLSGCTAIEYSYDATIAGQPHGAMTYYAIDAIKKANYSLTWSQLAKQVNGSLAAAQFNQHPQLEGKAANKRRVIFT